MYICIYTNIYTHTYIYIYICICIYIYIYILPTHPTSPVYCSRREEVTNAGFNYTILAMAISCKGQLLTHPTVESRIGLNGGFGLTPVKLLTFK